AFAGQARGQRERSAVLGEIEDRSRTLVEADVVVADVQARDVAAALAGGGIRGPVAAIALGHVDVADVVAVVVIVVIGVGRRRLVAGGVGTGCRRADGRIVHGAVGGPVVGGVARAQQCGDGKHGQGVPHGVLQMAVGAEDRGCAVTAACFAQGTCTQGTIAVHSGLENFSSTSRCAQASSSSRMPPAASPPWRVRKLSTRAAITASRVMPVWLRRGSTRFCALVVPLSDSFSRPMRSTSSILLASMS